MAPNADYDDVDEEEEDDSIEEEEVVVKKRRVKKWKVRVPRGGRLSVCADSMRELLTPFRVVLKGGVILI